MSDRPALICNNCSVNKGSSTRGSACDICGSNSNFMNVGMTNQFRSRSGWPTGTGCDVCGTSTNTLTVMHICDRCKR